MTDPAPVRAADVARYPLPGASFPTAVAFAPGGRWLTWLHSPDLSLTKALWALDLSAPDAPPRPVLAAGAAGIDEAELSLEERLRRERARDLSLGVTRYLWAERAERLVIPLADGVHVQDGVDGARRRVVDAADGPALDPRPSPDGAWVAFVRDGALWCVAADGSAAPTCVSSPGAEDTTHGLAEFVAQEELDRAEGYWWNPASDRLALCEVDERHVPPFRIAHLGDPDPAAEEVHRYPFAGAANAHVRLGVVDRRGGTPRWFDLPGLDTGEAYLAAVHWVADDVLVAEVLDRAQRRLDLVRCDAGTGATSVLHRETTEVWINLHDCFRHLDAGGFVWASERSGFRRLEVRDDDGSLRRVLGGDAGVVDEVVGVDAAHVWYVGWDTDPLERHLFRVPLDGGSPVRLTDAPGVHAAVVDPGHDRFTDTWSDLATPPRVELHAGGQVRRLAGEPDPRVASLDLRPPALTTVTAGADVLHGALFVPDGDGPFPLVLHVYGGPHVQRVTRSWSVTADLRAQHLRSRGYLVARVDNRGSWGRGLAFEGAIRGATGDVEVADQVAAVEELVRRGLADPARVGVIGWSYGGYLAAMCLARAPGTFRAAVAGAPVTDWDGYDTAYTERYLGTPAANPDGYRSSSVLTHADRITGALMLVHGLIDENVHFRHTARLVDRLNTAGVPHRLLVLPAERHSPRREADRVYLEEQVTAFLDEHLGPPRRP